MSLQLQPQATEPEKWILLAQKEQAVFEIMDTLSLPETGNCGINAQFRNNGMAASVHGAFIDVNPASGDPLIRELSRKRCRESCALAVSVGASNVVFHSSAFPFLRGAYLNNWASVCASFYDELAAQYPVKIYIENAQDLDPEPLRKLRDSVSSDRIGVCLDIGHANYSRVPMEQWFDVLEDSIGYFHLSDNNGSFDDHLPLGQGTVDWQLIHRRWEQLGRDIPITLETGSLADTEKSLAFLKARGYLGMKGNQHGE